jgi:hypothetical protein
VTITTIRPDATILAAGWRDGGGLQTLDGDVADNNDATYIVGTVGYAANGNYCQLRLGNISALASDDRVMRVRLRARYAKSTGGLSPDQRASVSIYDTVTIARQDMKAIRGVTTAVNEITLPWWTESPNPGAEGWGRTPAEMTTIINRLGVVCRSHNDYGGGGAFLRLNEIYCDVDIHEQVTLSTLDVTGEATTATPTVSWVYVTNADLDPQRSFQVKVFTLAQTTAAGFDAAGDEAVWDSGSRRSSATSVVIGKALVNGVTYVAYVRASSDFNGTDWWTSYSAASSFTMSFTPPPTPTLTVTQETTVPSLRNLLVVDTKLNLLSADDASFEGATTGSWGAQTNVTVVVSTTQKLDGLQSMRMTATGAGNMSAITAGGVFPYQIKAGQQYTALASFRAGSAGRSCRIGIQWVDQTGANMGAVVLGSNVTDTTGGFTQAFVTATAPAGSYGARLVVEVVSAGAAEIHYVDQADLHTGSSTTWSAGGLQKTDSFGYDTRVDRTVIEYLDWNMPTAETKNILNPNMASGGEFYGDTHGFAPRQPEDMVWVDRSGLQRDGEACVRWMVGETVGSILDLGTAQGVYSSFTEVPTATLPCVPGRTYTLSFYVRSVAGSHDLALAVTGIDQAGAAVGSFAVGGTTSVGTSWTRLSISITAHASAVGLRGEFRNVNGDLAEYLLDQGQLEEGAVATAWQRPTIMITNWLPVRGALTDLRGDIRDAIARIYDREAPPGVIRMYRAWTEIVLGNEDVSRSAFATYVPTMINPPGQGVWILKDPQQPAWDLQVHVEQISGTIEEDLTEAHPVRPNDRQPYGKRPVIVSDWISGKNGQATITLLTNEDWFSLQSLLHTPRTLLLQFPEGGQRYLRFTSRSWPRDKPRALGVHRIVVDFTEMSRPVVTG